MNAAVLGIFSVYIIMVGVAGNAPEFFAMLTSERGFVSWIVVLLILGALASSDVTQPMVIPFLMVAVIATLSMRYDDISAQIKTSYDYLTGAV